MLVKFQHKNGKWMFGDVAERFGHPIAAKRRNYAIPVRMISRGMGVRPNTTGGRWYQGYADRLVLQPELQAKLAAVAQTEGEVDDDR